ncbi:MAG: hypothetical protein ACREVA_08550 [Burkholderiales bacterium]
MQTIDIVELTAAGIMPLCLLLVIIEHLWSGRSFGARAIQFLAVGLIIPSILILALEEKLATETIATLIGALTGYLLSGIGSWESSEKIKKPEQAGPLGAAQND